ncbi:hypothetical protein Tco_0242874 [Tanacetum coccineum]
MRERNQHALRAIQQAPACLKTSWVLDGSIIVSATSSEGTGTKPGVLDKENVISKEKVILEWGSEQESQYSEEDQLGDEEKDDKDDNVDDEGDDYISDNQDADDEDAKTEFDKDEIYKYKIRVHKDEDVEMSNTEVEDSDKGDEEVTNAAKANAKKTSEVKDDAKKTELPLTSSSLFVSSVKIQSEVPHIQSPSMLRVPVSMISDPSILTPVQEYPSIATVTTLPPLSVSTIPPVPQQTTTSIPTPPITTDAPTITTTVSESDALFAVQPRVAKLEKDVSELKKIDLSAEALVALKIRVPSIVDNYLGSKVGDLPKKHTPTVDLEQELKKSPSKILKIKKEQAEKQKMAKFTIKSTNKASLKVFDQKSALYQTMHVNKSFNKNPANHRLYHALMEALIKDENAIDKGVADTGKKIKRRRTKESESSKKPSTTKETPKGKALSKGSKIGKSASTKEPVKEPTAEVVMDDVSEDVVRDDDQPQDASGPKTTKSLNPEWFKQPPRPPTPDPEWNKRDFVDLHLNKIEDMLLLAVQHKLFYLTNNDIVDFNMALRMFTKSLVIKKRVKDLQLSADELYKFSDGTLKKVRDELHHRIRDFHLEYNKEMPRRKWTAIDRKRSKLMVELIDKQMRERRIIQNLKRLVGARELEMDYKLMTCTT